MKNYCLFQITKFVEESLGIEEEGQTLVEYALIIAFVAIAIIGALTFLGLNLEGFYEAYAAAIP